MKNNITFQILCFVLCLIATFSVMAGSPVIQEKSAQEHVDHAKTRKSGSNRTDLHVEEIIFQKAKADLEVSVGLNSTHCAVMITLEDFKGLGFHIIDADGMILLDGLLTSEKTHIDMSSHTMGVYKLALVDQYGVTLRKFQVIKE